MERFLSLLLALSTLWNGWMASLFPGRYDAVAAMAPAWGVAQKVLPEPSALWAADTAGDWHGDADYADMEYTRYDPQVFYALTDELCALADAGELEGLYAAADRLYEEFRRMYSLTSLCFLARSADIYSDYWTDEYVFASTLWAELEDALFSAFDYVLQGPCGKSFSAFIGPIATNYYTRYEPSTDEDIARLERELQLVDDYYVLYDTMDEATFDYAGREWTRAALHGADGDRLGYDDYYEVYYGLQQALCRRFAPTYIDLVSLRQDIARENGYDSYTDYAYEHVYYRDYTPEDAQTLCDAVKPIAREFYADLYYCDAAYALYDVRPDMDGDAMAAALGPCLSRIDSRLTAPWEHMMDHGLYDLRPAGNGRLDSGFTIQLPDQNSSFIFDCQAGTCYDFITLTHEFGHFCNFYYNSVPNLILWTDDLDLSEIHSNGLQALFSAFYPEIFGADNAPLVEFANLSHLLESVIDGCMYDEFQRRVFSYPDALSAETLNSIYCQTCDEYGVYGSDGPPPWDAGWVYISHTFDSPFYYVSYAASAIAALQLWDISRRDFAAAADTYMAVLDHGAYAEGYTSVLEECGLSLFRDEGVAGEVCRPVLDRLFAISDSY